MNGICNCKNGYSGIQCETASSSCLGVSCLNGGNCESGMCICKNGYIGLRCETAPSRCFGVDCLNGGTCNRWDGHCFCTYEFIGERCEIRVAPSVCSPTPIIQKLGLFSVTASSSEAGSEPKNAFRPVTTTCYYLPGDPRMSQCIRNGEKNWVSGAAGTPQWLIMDFGATPRRICKFGFGTRLNVPEYARADGPMDYQLESADSIQGPWTESSGQNGTEHGYHHLNDWRVGDYVEHEIKPKAPRRYWRLYVNEVKGRKDGRRIVNIRDFKIYLETER